MPQATPPTIFGGFALLRAVLLRESISLVHAHGAFSAIAHEAIIHARTMGYKVGCRPYYQQPVFAHACCAGFRLPRAGPISILATKTCCSLLLMLLKR